MVLLWKFVVKLWEIVGELWVKLNRIVVSCG
jgi:hypothetical protein